MDDYHDEPFTGALFGSFFGMHERFDDKRTTLADMDIESPLMFSDLFTTIGKTMHTGNLEALVLLLSRWQDSWSGIPSQRPFRTTKLE